MLEADLGNRLTAEELQRSLGHSRIGHQLWLVEDTGSTNDLVWEAQAKGAAEGLVVFAERQTAGRGRHGRRWASAPGQGLWFSILLRPPFTMRESPALTSMLARVAAATII